MRKTVITFLLFLTWVGLASCRRDPGSGLDPTATGAVTSAVRPTATRILPSPTTTPAEPGGTLSPQGIQSEDLQGVEIRFWHPWIGETGAAVQELVEKFNAENPAGVIVRAESRSGDLYQDLWAGLNSGTFPTVVAAPAAYLQTWREAGNFVMDLGEYINDPEWGLRDSETADFIPILWEPDLHQGVRLGIPAYRSTNLLFYNQSWAQELGFDSSPETPVEFKKQACAAAAATTASLATPGVGGWIAGTDPAVVMSWVLAFGSDGTNGTGDGYHFNTVQVEETLEFIHSLFKSGCAWIPEERYPNQVFAERGGLFYSSSLAGLEAQAEAFDAGPNQDEWTVLGYPSPEGDPVINLYGPSFAVLKSTPRQQLAGWVFIRWLLRPENQAALAGAGGVFPASQSGLDDLEAYGDEHPQWLAAVELIRFGRSEPSFGSWAVARWALSEVALTLTSPEFTSDEIPLLLEDLDTLLAEIHERR